MQRPAKPCTPVRFRLPPPNNNESPTRRMPEPGRGAERFQARVFAVASTIFTLSVSRKLARSETRHIIVLFQYFRFYFFAWYISCASAHHRADHGNPEPLSGPVA